MPTTKAIAVDELSKEELLTALLALKKGNFSYRLPDHLIGIDGKIADVFNSIIDWNLQMVDEFDRVAREVGKKGKIQERVTLPEPRGSWNAAIKSINTLIGDVVQPTSEMARVIGAVAKGDLTQSIKVDLAEKPLRGEFLRTAKAVNAMVDQLSSFASEVTRVAQEVGTDGKLGGQAEVKSVSGTWKELTDSVNSMASNLTNQVRNIADVTIAVANGDLSKKITVDVRGEFLQLKDAINTMVEQLRSFSSEVTRVAREVGTDGRLGGQAVVPGVAGVWKDLTDNVNGMAANLTGQVRNIAQVTTAVAKGDLSTKITVDAKGEILELKNTINTMVDQLSSFASEVTRVAREVGTDGKLGGQAEVKGVSGTWKDLTDSVNGMAANLTGQVRNIAQVTTAVATGDLSKKITVDAKGEILELKNTVNTMVDQLSSFASEVTRVAREVGTDGKLGGQAEVKGVSGTWKDLTDSVNGMAANLTNQVRNIADVTIAVANGDLSKKITVDAKGEIQELKDTVNTMVDQLSSFASEVTRVAREVGTEGILGGQAEVKGVSGTWKDLTDSVNGMAANLTNQVRNIAQVTTAVATGDLSKKITVDAKGEIQELKNTINTMVDQLSSFASEVTRVAREVGTDGKLGGQAEVKGVSGTWKDLTDSVNSMAANLTNQVRNIADVTIAVANGDLSKMITVDVRGEFLQLKDAINTMVEQLRSFSSEVTRVAREVGTDGRLGGQAVVPGVAGVWKDLTDNVNGMAANLTGQVRNIAQVTTAVAKGDLSTKITVDAKGEILELKNTVNAMVDQLSSFASEVTRVAREVGTDGKLGGQAEVKGVSGTWKDLTDSVNGMAANLTGQVRNIAQVTTAVAKGDLSTKITVDAKGEILELKNTVNTMVDQLSSFASEVTRVAREVGTDGKLGGQAEVKGVSGTWKDLTDSVNGMAANLTGQVRNIAQVTTAVATGDLSKKITVDAKGEILELKDTVNTMVDQLSSFASEVTRVAREVGTDGKLGGQAEVKGVSGTWKDLTDSVNGMAANLTAQVRNIAQVTTAVALGDLSTKITVDAKGEILELKNTINTMVDQLSSFASEVTRVAREVGTEGILGGQAEVKGVSGTWKDLTDSVNGMAANLTGQVRNIAQVTTAVATGDLSTKITVDAKGEILELKDTVNTMVDQLSSFASEVTRVAREVGTDGMLGGQAVVPGVAGVWKDLTDNVNGMAANLTGQVRNIAQVTTAVAKGDLSTKITVDAKGEILELKNTINTMVDQLSSFASEVTRVAREVGTDGKLGGQAEVKGVSGTWKELTDSVNGMAANLTSQVRNIAYVTTGVARGDLTQKITVDAKGEILELKNTINTMVDQLSSFASEVTRVAREVGTEGILGGQAEVKGVSGTWKDLTDSVNGMAANLTGQVRNIAQVTTAVATGDLSKKITVDAKGEILELKNTINTMVDQLSSFASEVTRVAREVGTDGKLGGQAEVKGVSGTWKDLTDSVNGMAANLTGQVRNIAQVTTAVATGDLSKKITVDAKGEILELKNTVNTMVDQLSSFASEVTRVAREVGTDGKLGGQAEVKGVSGTWKDLTDSVNGMAANLTSQVRNIAQVTTAVATGDLSKKITVDAKGEILELKDTVNTMVDQLSSFASEVTRVAREVGTEGILGGQAEVRGVSGTWKDLTDSVNGMAANLTNQVRNIAQVTTAVATGDLSKKITVDAKGEILELKDTVNTMVDQLSSFASEVTRVAREVGTDGKLGGQAEVKGVSGTWKDLTDSVNSLAANLTTQVRAIADVATAVTKGDLTQSVQVEARGEVNELKNNINEMIRNLKDTTQKNAEQDWLKTNAARFARMLQGQKDLLAVSKMILSELAPLVNMQHGVFYVMESDEASRISRLQLLASYAYKERETVSASFALGEGIVGQCAVEKRKIVLHNVPDDYIKISSGLGEAAPLNIITLPITFEGQVKGVMELASFENFTETHQTFLDQLTESIGIVLNMIEASMRTEDLLKKSQSLTLELQQTNEELEEKAKLLAEQKSEVDRKNLEIETAKKSLEDKAEQLALTSKYKSEFLSNMSHELRTPLNSLLILAQQLIDNPSDNLSPKEVEYAKTIHASGNDLLMLINDILDLSKIESGTVELDLVDASFNDISNGMERTFRHLAEEKKLIFTINLDQGLPRDIVTDQMRLQQILKNLLSNAFKFTAKGNVSVSIARATNGWSPDNMHLNGASSVIAFTVTDTGIGVPNEKQKIIFEAFQQADGTTSRKYGGTGLGLAISREIAALLHGELRLAYSQPGVGSAFVLYVPDRYQKTAPEFAESQLDEHTEIEAGGQGKQAVKTAVEVVMPKPSPELSAIQFVEFDDDRENIGTDDRVIVVIEDDEKFATILLDMVRQKGFKGVVALNGSSGIQFIRDFAPHAITLDVSLPDMDGWMVLDRIKMDPLSRHIPVAIISGHDVGITARKRGAFIFLQKPVNKSSLDQALDRMNDLSRRKERSILIVEDNEIASESMVKIIESPDLSITIAQTAEDAITNLNKQRFDCMVLDLKLPGMSGLSLLENLQANPVLKEIPVIICTGKDLSKDEETKLKMYAQGIIIKGISTPERILDDTTLFLHRAMGDMPELQRAMLEKFYTSDSILRDRRILLVDDDIRNLFALTTVLERYGLEVVTAENGKDALKILDKDKGIDVVLMDIMMPEMDGFETMKRIRAQSRFKTLPIIALTAKAMKGDREKCIDAGASDYITKPVNTIQLATLLRVLFHRRETPEERIRCEIQGEPENDASSS